MKLGVKIIRTQNRKIVRNVYKFMKTKGNSWIVTTPLSKASQRTVSDISVSEGAVSQISKEILNISITTENKERFLTPNKHS